MPRPFGGISVRRLWKKYGRLKENVSEPVWQNIETRPIIIENLLVTKNNNNPEIKELAHINNNWAIEFKTGLLPPQAFTLVDNRGMIQNGMNVPIIYHYRRNKANKSLPSSYDDMENSSPVYSRVIPDRDFNDLHRINGKYWWLNDDAVHMDELRKRTKIKQSSIRRGNRP
ncbi:hypothetical protein PV325_011231 [Microctonus aethiopoides]|nr:hypothetical protein PV325_011231 [Microctonus aethiopoides]